MNIGFCGYIASGKSTSAHLLKAYLIRDAQPAEVFNFARPIKDTAVTVFGWNGEKNEKGRRLLQEIGTAGRNFDPDIWVNKALMAAAASGVRYRIFDDLRYPNEHAHMDLVIRVIRPTSIRNDHESEMYHPHFRVDITLHNQTMEALCAQIATVADTVQQRSNPHA